MYILDEIDAALDLSHTRFKGSQFIVVSLKEGLFTNANCYAEHGSGMARQLLNALRRDRDRRCWRQ